MTFDTTPLAMPLVTVSTRFLRMQCDCCEWHWYWGLESQSRICPKCRSSITGRSAW